MTSNLSLPPTHSTVVGLAAAAKAPRNPWYRFGPVWFVEITTVFATGVISAAVELGGSPYRLLTCGLLAAAGYWFLSYRFAKPLKWRLRHWSGPAFLAQFGAVPRSHGEADARNLFALLMDPNHEDRVEPHELYRLREGVDQEHAFVYDALQPLLRGLPLQSLAVIAEERNKTGKEAVGGTYADLVRVIETQSCLLTGSVAATQITQLERLMRDEHVLVAYCAAWALAHHHLAEGRREQADALFAKLTEKAPSLRALHQPAGTLAAAD